MPYRPSSLIRKRNRSQLKRNDQSIPIWLQYLNTFSSILLGTASFILAVMVYLGKQRVERMEDLISSTNRLVVAQDSSINNQKRQITQLQHMDSDVISLIEATNSQTSFVKNSSKPEIGLTQIIIDSLGVGDYACIVGIKNYGGRPALRVQDKFTYLKKERNTFKKLFETIDTAKNYPQSEIRPGQSISTTSEFGTTPEGYKQVKEGFIVIQIKYIDPLTGKYEYLEPFYFHSFFNYKGIATSNEALESDKILLRRMIGLKF